MFVSNVILVGLLIQLNYSGLPTHKVEATKIEIYSNRTVNYYMINLYKQVPLL